MIKLKPHQRNAVNQLHNGCILWGGVGSGKSFAALAYFYEKVCNGVINDWDSIKNPMDIIVITTAKKRDSLDWQSAALKFGISDEQDVSVGNATMTITVDSWNNIGKYEGVRDAFFVFDEQRLVGSGAWTKSFIKIAKRNQWILLSATPGDTWLDYIPVFVANGFYQNRTEFKREHVVYNTFTKFPKVDHYMGVGKLVRLRNSIRVHMPYESHAVRKAQDVAVTFDKKLMDRVVKDRWHVYEGRPLKGVAEMFYVMRKVANSDSSRITALRTLMEKHPRVIVFYNFDYELEILRTLAEPEMSSKQLRQTSNQTESQSHEKNSSLLSDTNSVMLNGNTGLDETEENDKWKDTIWSKDWDGTPEAEKRDTIPMQKAKYEFERKNRHLGQTSKTQQTNSKHSSGSNSNDGNETGSSTSVKVRNSFENQDDTFPTNGFQIAEWNGHLHQPIPDTDRWVYLVQYQAGAEGWNCITTDTMVFYSLTYSYKMWHQAHGRIDRLNTPFEVLNYYVLKSNSWIDIMIGRALGMKKNFQEANYKDLVDS